MDFMKVIDQTVREIKREVNLKVLKVPEIEQKVLDATSDEPWGPHGSDLADIARATKRLRVPNGECEMIMNVLWQRLGDTGANWRHVYKALAVIEYLLANGAERAIDDALDNSSQVAKLTKFEYMEPNGKDVGLNVRKKAETVLAILDDREKLQQVREKAAATRDKYFGLSSTGMTYKSSAASFGSGSYSSGNRYGSTGYSREADLFKDTHISTMLSNSSTRQRSKEASNSATRYVSTKGEGQGRRNRDSSTSHSKPLSNLSAAPGGPSSPKEKIEDDDDDFNPRGSSTPANGCSNHGDLFGPSLMDGLADTTASTSTSMPNVGTRGLPEVDLFADAAFQSANAPLEAPIGSHTQDNVDLFASRSSFTGSFTSDTEFSECSSPNKSSEQKLSSPAHHSGSAFDPFQPSFATTFPSNLEFSMQDSPSKPSQEKPPAPEHASTAAFDPFAAVPVKSFDGSDPFGAFSSNTGSAVAQPSHDSPGGIKSYGCSPLEELNFGVFTSHTESPTGSATMNKSPAKLEQASMSASRPAVKKETFQVKSGIWADSLSRGLIDLNITAPKKVNLSDIGVVGQPSDGSEKKGPAAPWYMGTTMGTGSGLGRSSFPSSTGATSGSGNFQQQQFGNFK